MGWTPLSAPLDLLRAGLISHNEARAMGLTAPTIVPRPPARRHGTIECDGCGAPVHPHEHACSYCTRIPDLGGCIDPIVERMGWINITTLNDPEPVFLKETRK